MNKTIFVSGAVFGILGILLGAFGAHGLEKMVDNDAVQTWGTGVTYQMYHALLLLIMANLKGIPEAKKKWSFYAIVGGIVLFSFSIYLLATNSIIAFDFKVIGFVTPLGGLLFILGWALLARLYVKYNI